MSNEPMEGSGRLGDLTWPYTNGSRGSTWVSGELEVLTNAAYFRAFGLVAYQLRFEPLWQSSYMSASSLEFC